MAEQWFVRGENGIVQAMDLPLPPHFEGRIRKGDLERVNEDGSPLAAGPVLPEPAGDRVPDAGEAAADMPPLPAASASRGVWAEFAASQGMDPETVKDMTKAQLVAEFTRTREAP